MLALAHPLDARQRLLLHVYWEGHFRLDQLPHAGSILRASVDDPIRRGSAAHVLRPDDAQRGNGEAIQPNQRWALLVAGSSGWWNYRQVFPTPTSLHYRLLFNWIGS